MEDVLLTYVDSIGGGGGWYIIKRELLVDWMIMQIFLISNKYHSYTNYYKDFNQYIIIIKVINFINKH